MLEVLTTTMRRIHIFVGSCLSHEHRVECQSPGQRETGSHSLRGRTQIDDVRQLMTMIVVIVASVTNREHNQLIVP
jgi:hypothetical protein